MIFKTCIFVKTRLFCLMFYLFKTRNSNYRYLPFNAQKHKQNQKKERNLIPRRAFLSIKACIRYVFCLFHSGVCLLALSLSVLSLVPVLESLVRSWLEWISTPVWTPQGSGLCSDSFRVLRSWYFFFVLCLALSFLSLFSLVTCAR